MEVGSKNIKESNVSKCDTNLDKLFIVFVILSNVCKLMNLLDHWLKFSSNTNLL